MQSRGFLIASLMAAAVVAGASTAPASVTVMIQAGQNVIPTAPNATVIPIAHQGKRPYLYRPQHQKFHQRYNPKHPQYGAAHNRFHRHHRRRHDDDGPDIDFGWYGDFYDPFYYDPYVYDPYYLPYERTGVNCNEARRLLGAQGYRNIRAYDCSGSRYGFYAIMGKKRYKITVSAVDGHITSRRQS
jgi:hypothetical protein